MSKISFPKHKHHEFVNEVDYRNLVQSLYDKNIAMSPEYIERHNKLIKNSGRPFERLDIKNFDIASDIYHTVIGYTEQAKFFEHDLETGSLIKGMFDYSFEFQHGISSLIRKFATLYSLHKDFKRAGEFYDPVCVLYDEPRDKFVVTLGQQRCYYSQLLAIPLNAYIYTLGNQAAKKVRKYFPQTVWQKNMQIKYTMYIDSFESLDKTQRDIPRLHFFPSPTYDPKRNDTMAIFQKNVLDFIYEFMGYEEEIYYYHKDSYLAFIPNKYATKKIRVDVDDHYGVVQHALWRYCQIEDFVIEKRFSVSEF